MVDSIIKNKDKLQAIFRRHRIAKAWLFGSAIHGNFNENSDLDFIIEFEEGMDPLEQADLWWSLHDTLRDFFNREIDLLTGRSLKNPYLIKEIEKTKSLIYG